MKQNTNKKSFYDKYHEKNDFFFEVIGENNFTYFYIQKALHKVLMKKKIRNVLDVGCGVGTLGFYLAGKGMNVSCYDISPRAISIANQYKEKSGLKNIEFKNKDVQQQKFIKTYDLVICTEVIEHLKSDDKMLVTIYKALNKGSFLLLSTPSVNAPLFRLGLLSEFDFNVGHLRRYKLEELEEQIKAAGFSIIESNKVESVVRNSLFTFPILGNFIRFIKGPFIPLFHFFDSFFTLLFGESDIIVIARKN